MTLHTICLIVGTWVVLSVVFGVAYSLLRMWEKQRGRR